MKTIGIIGGMSWESSHSYYRLLNQKVNAQLGGLHSAKVILYSVDFADIEPFQRYGHWQQAAGALCKAACALESAGADAIVIATNTMHKVAPEVSEAVSIPLLHIVDATTALAREGAQAVILGCTEIGLLVQQSDVALPLFDTTEIHVSYAVDWALNGA